MRSFTTDPLLEDTPHEHEDNSAQCNCGAKIYYATREEMQQQLALLSTTVPDSVTNSECQSGPCIPGAGPIEQSLPMPDMCMINNSPAKDRALPDPPNQCSNNLTPKCEQSSFITFKPPNKGEYQGCMRDSAHDSPIRTSIYSTQNELGSKSQNSPKVTAKLLPCDHSSNIKTLDNRVKTRENPYGVRDARITAANIYSKTLPQLPCSECVKESTLAMDKKKTTKKDTTTCNSL